MVIGGSFKNTKKRTVAGTSDTLVSTDYLVEYSSTSTVTITLPTATSVDGIHYIIHKIGASGTINIGNGTDTIDGVSGTSAVSLTTQYDKVHLFSDSGTNWLIL